MANKKLSPHLPTILNGDSIDEIYELWGVGYEVKISLPEPGETPENVRSGFCGAYMLHFKMVFCCFRSCLSYLKPLQSWG